LHSIIEFQLLSTIRFDIAGESKTRATTNLPRKNRKSWQLPWSERARSSRVARSWGVGKQFTLATHSRSRVLYQQQPTPTRAFRVRTTTPDGRDRSNHKVTWRERAQTSCDMQRNLTRNDVVPRAARSSSHPWRRQQQRQADSGTHTTWGEEEAAAAAAAQKEEVVTTSNDKILLRHCFFCCSCFFFFCWVLFLALACCRLNTR